MRTFELPGTAVSALLWSCVVATSLSATPASGQSLSDRRLDTALECRVPGRSVASLLTPVAAATGVALSAEQYCSDQKIVLAAQGKVEAADLLRRVATHCEFQWLSSEAKEGASSRFRLVQSRSRRNLGERLRTAAARERTERVLRRLELRLRYTDASPAVLASLREQDPFIQSVATDPALRARLGLVKLMTPLQRRAVAAGQPFVSPPLSDLPGEVQQLARRAAGPQVDSRDRTQLRYVVRLEGNDGSDHLTLRVVGLDGRPVGVSSDLTFTDPPRRDAGMPLGAAASDPRHRPKDAALLRTVELVDEKGRPVSIAAGLPVLLEALSRATGWNVLSDYYSAQRVRFDPEPLGKRPVWQILRILSLQYSLAWRRSGSWLTFRHREWYLAELEEIPERLLNRWRTASLPPDDVSARDYFDVISALAPEQMEGLQFQFPAATLSPPFRWERFWKSIGPVQRERLLGGEVITASKAIRDARTALFPNPQPAPDASSMRVRLVQNRAVLEGSIEEPGATLRYHARLPARQPQLPPVLLAR